MSVLYPNGTKDVAVSADIAIFTEGTCQVYYQLAAGNIPSVPFLSSTVSNGTVTLTPGSSYDTVRLEAGTEKVYYLAGSSPVLSVKKMNSVDLSTPQGAPAAATVSATLTAANLTAGIITVNQGASGATAQTLPLATAVDTALPDAAIGYSFDFSVINISTDAAEDCTMTTNTGWTLVGSMVVASNAAATDKSAGRFKARKTAAGAWTLYRLS